MSFADLYLSKQRDFSPRIQDYPGENLKYIVVVPCYREPQIVSTLESLRTAAANSLPTEVIVVVNSSDKDSDETIRYNKSTSEELKKWSNENSSGHFKVFIIEEHNLPRKFAGVGLARKIGMDEAIHRFNLLNNKNGVIISFDADSECDKDFFSEIDSHYKQYPETNGTTIYFEHPLEGDEFSAEIYDAIVQYELYLRYFVHALRYTSFPYAFHTVGSCFNVRAEAYMKQGGMNKRQGGEDFYFLHKIIPLGNFYEINNTRVVPSPRTSDRVPFGTGPVIKKIVDSNQKVYETYNFEAFEEIKKFLELIPRIYECSTDKKKLPLESLPMGTKTFLENEDVNSAIKDAYTNSASLYQFKKRMLTWFSAFRLIKCLNFLHEKYYIKGSVIEEAKKLLNKKEMAFEPNSGKELLYEYREMDKAGDGLSPLQ